MTLDELRTLAKTQHTQRVDDNAHKTQVARCTIRRRLIRLGICQQHGWNLYDIPQAYVASVGVSHPELPDSATIYLGITGNDDLWTNTLDEPITNALQLATWMNGNKPL